MKMKCKGGKKSTHRKAIAFFVNGVGESESPPIVIWQSKHPHGFKGVWKESLSFICYSRARSWMTGELCMTSLGP